MQGNVGPESGHDAALIRGNQGDALLCWLTVYQRQSTSPGAGPGEKGKNGGAWNRTTDLGIMRPSL